jgi:hypothetical protein
MKVVVTSFLAVLFLVESLFPKGVALTESFKIFQLVSHYTEHVCEFKDDISFGQFLWMHYNPESDHEDASHHHEKLPDFHSQTVFVSICFNPFKTWVQVSSGIEILNRLFVSAYENKYFFLFSSDLLNPPQ